MSVAVVRYRTKPDRADENQALIEKVFGELDGNRPAPVCATPPSAWPTG